MNKALLYQPCRRSGVWVAFVCAAGIHVAAVMIAANGSDPVNLPDFTTSGPEVEVEDASPAPSQEPEFVTPLDQVATNDEDLFPPEDSTPPPVQPRKKTAIAPVARNAAIGTTTAHFGSVRELALYAPRPAYPYEARQRRITGSGSVELTVNRDNGNVIEARMAQSTGSGVLDNSALSTCRNWRFRPGTVTRVIVPITYTLYGASY